MAEDHVVLAIGRDYADIASGFLRALGGTFKLELDLKSPDATQMTAQLGLGDVSLFPEGQPMHLAGVIEGDVGTSLKTTLEMVFQTRCGVCQDFSHLMLGCLRSMGLAGRYVSGYIETLPKPGKPKLVGADATHAWVLLWCGPDLGWVGVDPTNGI